jgi:hypothetical protein
VEKLVKLVKLVTKLPADRDKKGDVRPTDPWDAESQTFDR